MPFVNQRTTAWRPVKSSSAISPPCAEGRRSARAGSPILGITVNLDGPCAVNCSTEEREDEERVAAPAGRLLDFAAARQPRLGFRFVAPLDGERGQAFVTREQELRLADGLGDLQRAPVVVRARIVLAAALVDLGED